MLAKSLAGLSPNTTLNNLCVMKLIFQKNVQFVENLLEIFCHSNDLSKITRFQLQ